mgnify:CR=1 FL=1
MVSEELNKILADHQLWLNDKTTGKRANLMDADLDGADLMDADLTDADLRGADLDGADLTGADLRGADLRGAKLLSANLTDADLDGAVFGEYYICKQIKKSKNIKGVPKDPLKRLA